jgi:hypothetical protein
MTPQQEQLLRSLEKRLNDLEKSDRFSVYKLIQMFDGKNFQFGQTTGTKLGLSASEKSSFHGVAPVVQAGAISAPTAPSGTYVQAEAQSMETAVNAIRTALQDKGITS